MAISVKDIQEKEFSTQAADGYNVEQVDDFLDELAEQLGTMIRESLALTNQVKQLESELAAARRRRPTWKRSCRTTMRTATSATWRAPCANP